MTMPQRTPDVSRYFGSSPLGSVGERPILITGGAGFIGSNLAATLLHEGCHVRLLDNLSRAGVRGNLEWLTQRYPERLRVLLEDVRDTKAILKAVDGCAAVFHLAAQVAVTTSLSDPLNDFEINLGGTLKLLEALRRLDEPLPIIFTSTNKVYGALEHLKLIESEYRYIPADDDASRGVSEAQSLDFRSAYGCSKGAADQYVLDYARSFGLPTVVFRMSCIYGPHQCGSEDQGWVSHVVRRITQGQPVVIYGDGKQVRDLLFIDDLVSAFKLALSNIRRLAGNSFNIGGGPANTLSLLELIGLVAELSGSHPDLHFARWRVGDQKYYVSDSSKFYNATAWTPRVGVHAGVTRLYDWIIANGSDSHMAPSVQSHG